MKKAIAAVLLSMTMFLTACGGYMPPEEEYIGALHEGSDTFDKADEKKLISAGKDTCDYFTENGVNQDTINILLSTLTQSFGDHDARLIIQASTDAFCEDVRESIQNLYTLPS